jgi:hypothetical protein
LTNRNIDYYLQETAGRSLESLDSLFERPWYTVHKVAYPTRDDLKIERSDIKEAALEGIYVTKGEVGGLAKHIE